MNGPADEVDAFQRALRRGRWLRLALVLFAALLLGGGAAAVWTLTRLGPCEKLAESLCGAAGRSCVDAFEPAMKQRMTEARCAEDLSTLDGASPALRSEVGLQILRDFMDPAVVQRLVDEARMRQGLPPQDSDGGNAATF